MAKISISEAAKRFDVSRPTLQKHLKTGKISGDKDTVKGWQIDTAELARVYQPRMATYDKDLPDTLSPFGRGLDGNLHAEIERLKTELAVVSALADERGKRLDQLVPLLTGPPKKKWWQGWLIKD